MGIRTRIKSIGSNALPEGYTRAEYLESTKTQYIITDNNVTQHTGVRIEYKQRASEVFVLEEAIGTRNNGYYWFVPRREPQNISSQEFFYYTSTWAYLKNWGQVIVEMNYKNSGVLNMKNLIGNTYSRSLPAKKNVVLPPLRICGSTTQSFDGWIWSCEITEGQEIVSKFIPALDSTGTPCMYDLVTRTPFRNDGTGNFLYKTVKYPFKPTDNFVSFKNKVKATLPPELEYDVSYDRESNILSIKVGNDISRDAINIIQNYIDTLVESDVTVNFEYTDGLPARYARLAYLENINGGDNNATHGYSASILTDIRPTQNTRGKLVAEAVMATRNHTYYAFGCSAGSDQEQPFGCFWSYRPAGNAAIFKMNGINASNDSGNMSADVHTLEFGKDGFRVDGVLKGTFSNMGEFKSPRQLIFLAETPNAKDKRCFRGKAYSFQLWEGDKPILNFIPALDPSGVPGMYDTEATTVENAFKKSVTSAPFVAGMTLQQVREMNLPVPGTVNKLSLSIPCEVYNDSEAWGAIEAAQQKGWTFTFYWTNVVAYLTPQLNAIVGSGNYTISYNYQTSELSLTFALSVAEGQVDEVESLLERVLSSNIVIDMKWEDGLPTRYKRVEYLQTQKYTGLATDFLPSNETEVFADVLRVNDTYYGRLCGNYGGGDAQNMFAIHHFNGSISFDFGDYRTDVIPTPSESHIGKRYTAKYGQSGIFINGTSVADVSARPQFKATVPMYIFTVPQSAIAASGEYQVFSFIVYDAGEIVFNFIPTLDMEKGAPCMFDLVSKKPFYNIGEDDFIAGLTMAHALNLANLPSTGGNLTVSLPSEAAFDTKVQSALNTAAGRGWTIIVQYRESELTTDPISL